MTNNRNRKHMKVRKGPDEDVCFDTLLYCNWNSNKGLVHVGNSDDINRITSYFPTSINNDSVNVTNNTLSPLIYRFQHDYYQYCAQHRTCLAREQYPMKNAVEERRYDIVQFNLRSRFYDPNEEILFSTVYMTGLEYSVYKGDWRMAILFFLNFADPEQNCFDGTILADNTVKDLDDSGRRILPSRTHNAFIGGSRRKRLKRTSKEINGFDGLYCLANRNMEEFNKLTSSLWLMNQCHSYELLPHKSTIERVRMTREHLCTIDVKNIWDDYFKKIVFTSLLSLHRCFTVSKASLDDILPKGSARNDIPNDVLIYVLEYILDSVLLETIHKGLIQSNEVALKLIF